MRIRSEYNVMDMAVMDGAGLGVRRAFKHTDNPTEDQIINEVHRAVMNELSEWFSFEEAKDGGF